VQPPANYPTPKVTHPALRVVRSRMPEAFTARVETPIVAGCPVKITRLDRTIVDCFKPRNLVTLELCLEALRERMKMPRRSLQDLHRYAAMMRVSRIIQPYLEALSRRMSRRRQPCGLANRRADRDERNMSSRETCGLAPSRAEWLGNHAHDNDGLVLGIGVEVGATLMAQAFASSQGRRHNSHATMLTAQSMLLK
jgi:hypothetical protein